LFKLGDIRLFLKTTVINTEIIYNTTIEAINRGWCSSFIDWQSDTTGDIVLFSIVCVCVRMCVCVRYLYHFTRALIQVCECICECRYTNIQIYNGQFANCLCTNIQIYKYTTIGSRIVYVQIYKCTNLQWPVRELSMFVRMSYDGRMRENFHRPSTSIAYHRRMISKFWCFG